MTTPSLRRFWLLPIAVLTATALGVFWGFYLLDHFVTGGRPSPAGGPLRALLHFDPVSITDAVSSLAGMIAAVLGIVITVVSIIVQLSRRAVHRRRADVPPRPHEPRR